MKGTKTGDYTTPLIPIENMQEEFLAKLVECEEFFIRHQMLAINSNIESFRNMRRNQRKQIGKLKIQICQEFIENFCLKPLNGNDHICKKYAKQISINYYTGEHSHKFSAGNFYERAERKNASWIERMELDGMKWIYFNLLFVFISWLFFFLSNVVQCFRLFTS